MVERCVRDAEAVGSNPVASTKKLIFSFLGKVGFYYGLDENPRVGSVVIVQNPRQGFGTMESRVHEIYRITARSGR